MIQIDRINAHLDVLRSPASGAGQDTATAPAATTDAVSLDRIRTVVLEVLREHLRDLERRGLL